MTQEEFISVLAMSPLPEQIKVVYPLVLADILSIQQALGFLQVINKQNG